MRKIPSRVLEEVLKISSMALYKDLRPNKSICAEFTQAMAKLGLEFVCDLNNIAVGGGSTDMG